MSAQSLGLPFKGDVMTENQPAWMKCLSENLFDEAKLSCSEYRAFEYRKCDGCPNSEFMSQTHELSDPHAFSRNEQMDSGIRPFSQCCQV
jgi:hypothetical protein